MNEPSLSVVVPLYNKALYIERCLASIFSQQPPVLEVIVVDDSSTDGGAEIVANLNEPRVRLIYQQDGHSEGITRNRGIREAAGDLVAFCDADDEWLPGFTETILRLEARFPQCGTFATGYLMREPDGVDVLPIHAPAPEDEGILVDYFETGSRSDTPLCSSCVAARRDLLLEVGGFGEGMAIGADLITWVRLAANAEVGFSREPRAVFYQRGTYPAPPVRHPDIPDVVGEELHQLARVRGGASVRRFVSMWHRSRALILLHHGDRRRAAVDVGRAMRYDPKDKRLYVIAALTVLPTGLGEKALRKSRAARRSRRMADR